MAISDDDLRLVRFCVAEMVLRRQRTGEPIPTKIHRLLATLSGAARGSESEPVAPPSNQDDDELIDTDQAAAILGCSTRWIRTIAADLDGTKVAGRWVFSRHHVTDYATGRAA